MLGFPSASVGTENGRILIKGTGGGRSAVSMNIELEDNMCRVRVDMSESETKELITQLTAILEMKAWCYVLGSVKFTKTYDADKLN